jgi:hypothetical protein
MATYLEVLFYHEIIPPGKAVLYLRDCRGMDQLDCALLDDQQALDLVVRARL